MFSENEISKVQALLQMQVQLGVFSAECVSEMIGTLRQNIATETDEFMTIQEAAAKFHITSRSIYNFHYQGKIRLRRGNVRKNFVSKNEMQRVLGLA